MPNKFIKVNLAVYKHHEYKFCTWIYQKKKKKKKKKEHCIKFPTIPIYSIVKHTIGPTLWTGVLYSLYIVYHWLRHKYTLFFFFFFFF